MVSGWKPRGILNPIIGATKFQLTRHLPAPDLTSFIERYWIIQWNLVGQVPYTTETLPQPYVNLVFEAGNSRIYGVASRKYTNRLEGQGQVFGIKFRPGAFYPLIKRPVAALTDQSIPVADLFGNESTAIETAILAAENVATKITLADNFLRPHLPAFDPTITLVNQIVDRIIADRTITKVEDLTDLFALTRRTLQRLFNHYVGINPKWVIKRYRLHEAAELLATGNAVNLPALALDLGYFDQAHFNKDFKALVGLSPVQYAKQVGIST